MAVLPSSHCSTPTRRCPSPQEAATQLLRQASVWIRLPSSQPSTPAWTVVAVAVVAGLFTGVDEAVTTECVEAAAGAGVRVDPVAVITFFDPGQDEAVAAAGRATLGAGVGVVLVAVVALLDAGKDQAIAASGRLTFMGAVVVRLLVAVVASLLAAPEYTVAANGSCAIRLAGVEDIQVAVVTGLVARLALGEVISVNPIAAAGQLALIGAGVVGIEVAVIAGFARIEVAITAARRWWRAGIRAGLTATVRAGLTGVIDGALPLDTDLP